MTTNQEFDPSSLLNSFTKSAIDYWQSAASTWQAIMSASAMGFAGQKNDPWAQPMEAWKALWAGAIKQENVQNLIREGLFPEIGLAATRTFFDGCRNFQDLLKSVAGKHEDGSNASFAKVQQEMFQAWLEFHEKDIQPVLRAPQIGLTRLYQEKMNHLLDRFASYQTAFAEFQALLYLPMEKSLNEMQEKLDPAKNENLSGDFKEYYGMWIKTLEGHYMELFKSQDWNDSLCRIVAEAADFKMVRNELMMDFMQFLPIPTNKDMDEVYKELYQLKKMVKQLAKRIDQEELNLS